MIYMSLIYVFLLVGPAIGAIAFFRRLSTRWHWFLLSVCVFYGISPLLVTWGAFGLARRLRLFGGSCRLSLSFSSLAGRSYFWVSDVALASNFCHSIGGCRSDRAFLATLRYWLAKYTKVIYTTILTIVFIITIYQKRQNWLVSTQLCQGTNTTILF